MHHILPRRQAASGSMMAHDGLPGTQFAVAYAPRHALACSQGIENSFTGETAVRNKLLLEYTAKAGKPDRERATGKLHRLLCDPTIHDEPFAPIPHHIKLSPNLQPYETQKPARPQLYTTAAPLSPQKAMSDRRPPRPHSPAMYNPARASAPSINYGKYNDLHDLPGIRDTHPAPPPRSADRAPPPVVTHYKVVPPPEIPRSDPREGGHSRRATLDSNPRPIIVTADARYPVAQGGGPSSPVRDNYRSSQENDVYTIPSSSTRRGDYRRGQYNMSVDNADINNSDRESGQDRLMRVGSGREGAIYPRSRPIHSDTLVRVPDNMAEYGDNDYGYTNPRDLVQYDLDLDRAPRRRPRRESYEASRSSRPSSISSYGDITRSYEPRERERERERERRPPPSSRGFDKIPPRGPVYDVGGMNMPMPHEHLSSLGPSYASDSQERRSSTRRPVSVYNEEPERRKYAADAYEMSDDEMINRRPRRTDTFDGGIETRGFGIRADIPPVPPAPVPERVERSEKHEYERGERVDRDDMEYEKRYGHEERKHGHEERTHGHEERKHGKEAVAAGLSVAAAALGLGATKGGREGERDERDRKRGRDSDEERRRRREKEEEPIDLGGRDHGERRRERDSDEERRRRREKEGEAVDLSGRDYGDRRRERDSDEERRRRREVKEEDPVVDLTGRDPVERLPPRPEKVSRDESDVESRRRRDKEKPYREDMEKDYRRRDEKEPSSDKDQPPAIVDLNGRNPVEKPIYKEDLANREPVIEVPERRK
ncbi:hypothetical protein V498_00929, partial [Pseudogymnoascus sp. VKM F-4517 (FW-2822)]